MIFFRGMAVKIIGGIHILRHRSGPVSRDKRASRVTELLAPDWLPRVNSSWNFKRGELFARVRFSGHSALPAGTRLVPLVYSPRANPQFWPVPFLQVSKIQGIVLACKYMRECGGVIINHSSVLGLDADPHMIAYSAASAGLIAASRAFSVINESYKN